MGYTDNPLSYTFHLEISSPDVHPFNTELPWSDHRVYVNQFYIESRGEIIIEKIDGFEYIRNEQKEMYMLLEENCKDDCDHPVMVV